MRLFIAEKPSLGKKIAENLPGKWSKNHGFLENDRGDVVTWCIGHIYQLAPPKYYVNNSFSFEALPIIPREWKIIPSESLKDQVNVVARLLKKAKSVVHAGDPDREGQLIVDELLTANNCRLPVERLWVHAMDNASMKTALGNLRQNHEFLKMGYAAQARSRADWLVGMNLSPAFTLSAQRGGFQGTLSIGRVQTPTLSIVVSRDNEIENFVPKDYWSISADIQVAAGEFPARYRVPKDVPGVDDEGRVVDKRLADAIVSRVSGQKGVITKFETKLKSEKPPLTFSLSSLTVMASRRFGYGAQLVLDTCQSLYEKHELTTYPRTDCEYLPESYTADVAATMKHLANNFQIAAKANLNQKGRVFDDKKVTAHHAIVPTTKQANLSLLSQVERNIYELIATHYIAQFFPDYQYNATNVEVTFSTASSKDEFTASGRIDVDQGWRAVLKTAAATNQDETGLPAIVKGEPGLAKKVTAQAKKTEPPKRYTEGTLLEAMTNVHSLVTDPAIKKRLKEVAGIGTEATRASIIETLFKREFIVKDGKFLVSTPTGRALIGAVPNSIKDPGMTALWEASLESIKDGKMTVDQFIDAQSKALLPIIELAKSKAISVPSIKSKANISLAPKETGKSCPKCQKPLLSRVSKKGTPFIGCSGYPACDHVEWDNTQPRRSYGGKAAGRSAGKSGSKGRSKGGFDKRSAAQQS